MVVLDGEGALETWREYYPLGAKHRIENRTNELLVFIEVQTGTYFGKMILFA